MGETIGLSVMRWSCKNCNFKASKRLELLTHYRLKHLHSGEPLEYILDAKEGMSFQYIQILQTLSHVLKNTDSARHCGSSQYTSFRDGSHYKENAFLSGEELRLSLLLYRDDFEI